jgi:nucleotide-binding universal stress UspA family protein
MKRLLSPTDLSEVSRHALVHAAALARVHGSRLRVLYVADAFPGGRTVADAKADLDRFLAGAALPAADVDAVVVTGDPKQEILAASAASETDCIVMGTHGRGGFERFVIGSVTEHVLRKARVPVLAVPPGDHRPAPDGTFRTVVCGLDLGASSPRALAYASQWAAANAQLHLVHSITWPFGSGPGALPPEIEALRASLVADATEQIRKASAGVRAGLRVEAYVSADTPYEGILRRARETSADLIVVGLHSHATGDLALLGSTTRRVLHDAPCPVLTVSDWCAQPFVTTPSN